MRIRFVFIISFLLSLILTPLLRAVALRLKILDHPAQRKIHQVPMPLLGGAAVYLAFLVPMFLLGLSDRYLMGLVLGATLIFVTGLVDDLKKLPALFRLMVQLIAAIIVISSGMVLSFLPNTFWGNAGEILLTIIWILGLINALNCLDGIDGLAATLTITQGLCFLVIAYQTRQFLVGCVSAALVGSSLGFLKYNFNPARIFLGDAGSTLIGFIFAVIALMGTWAENNFVSIFVPVFILGVPIFDMTLTTIMRLREKKVINVLTWLSYTGKDHFHHRLLDLGFGPRSAVVFIASISLSIGISGILLMKRSIATATFMLLQAAMVFMLIGILMVVSAREKSKHV